MYDTIIIGAGMSGLAAGIRLAYYQQRVCILERHFAIGGLNSFYRLRGRDYDVGLHAITNYAPRGVKRGPLASLLRQLRLQWDDFALAPQIGSTIRFPGVDLHVGNGLEILDAEIADKVPGQQIPFRRLLQRLLGYDEIHTPGAAASARQVLGELFGEPLLVEMLLCPLMWYGNAREHDMDFGTFSMLFRSVFLEGLARPYAGVRLILRSLVRKFRDMGGELRLRSGVAQIKVDGQRATGVVLEDGTELAARRILSSAGLVETLRLCQAGLAADPLRTARLSFCEAVSILDRPPKTLGFDRTIVFYNDSHKFHWETPAEELVDARTGVVCSPNNYLYEEELNALPEGVIRISALANFDRWSALSEEDYTLAKLRCYDRMAASAVRFIPEFRSRVIDTDMFTPKTICRFTRHEGGAVYGAPEKRRDGTTHLQNVFLCGTDQGLVGIVGSIISGITIANRHCLRE